MLNNCVNLRELNVVSNVHNGTNTTTSTNIQIPVQYCPNLINCNINLFSTFNSSVSVIGCDNLSNLNVITTSNINCGVTISECYNLHNCNIICNGQDRYIRFFISSSTIYNLPNITVSNICNNGYFEFNNVVYRNNLTYQNNFVYNIPSNISDISLFNFFSNTNNTINVTIQGSKDLQHINTCNIAGKDVQQIRINICNNINQIQISKTYDIQNIYVDYNSNIHLNTLQLQLADLTTNLNIYLLNVTDINSQLNFSTINNVVNLNIYAPNLVNLKRLYIAYANNLSDNSIDSILGLLSNVNYSSNKRITNVFYPDIRNDSYWQTFPNYSNLVNAGWEI